MLKQYYNNHDEDGRLKKDNVHSIEYQTTLHFLQKHLLSGSNVLDCCAGCGIYAFPLADLGYSITACDLMKKHVDLMMTSDTENMLKAIYQGNVLDMSRFSDASFDAVLCMGALYHLQTGDERERCLNECLRVLKPNGLFAFAYINRNALFINHFKRNPQNTEDGESIMKYGKNDIFYGMAFGEADALADKFKLKKITDIGVDGLIYPLYDEINSLDDKSFKRYMEYHLATCEEPSIIGHSMHSLWIGRKSNVTLAIS